MYNKHYLQCEKQTEHLHSTRKGPECMKTEKSS